MKPSEEYIDRLVEESQNGNVDSFSRLYDEYLDSVYRFVYFKTSSEEGAEDITSEVFLKVWNNLDKYSKSPNIPFSAWLFRIASNQVTDYFRQKKDTLELKEELEIPDESFGPVSRDLENKINRQYLEKSLREIPDSQAEVLILKFFSDLSNKEISQIINKSETAVRILQSRGLKALKPVLEKYSFSSNTI